MKRENFRLVIILAVIILSPLVTIKASVSVPEAEKNTEGYFNEIKDAFDLTQDEIELLNQNDFVVLNRLGTDDILDAYMYYWKHDLPIVITTDAMLHTWHLVYDNNLENLEKRILFPLLINLTKSMLDLLIKDDLNDNLSIGKRDIVTYLSVALLLNDTSAPIPDFIKKSAFELYNVIMSELYIVSASARLQSEETIRFVDDFTQYKPRGHYTNSEILQKYFRLFKWLSRIPFLFTKSSLGRTVEEHAEGAITLTWLLKHSKVNINNTQISGIEVWNIFAKFLDKMIGRTYSLSPIILDSILTNLTSKQWGLEYLNEDLLTEVVANVHSLKYTHYVFFGERLTLDTYAFNHVVHPYVQNRLMPVGLDFAITMLNSSRALELLQPSYTNQINSIRSTVNNWKEEEKDTLVMHWVDSLSELTKEFPNSDSGYNKSSLPVFMQKTAWKDEKLTTVMGSYAQLKHDTILYSIQAGGGFTCLTPEGYVEPYPVFYNKLRQINSEFQNLLDNFLDLGIRGFTSYFALPMFDYALKTLEDISMNELTNIPLTESQRSFINTTFSIYRDPYGNTRLVGWLSNIIKVLNPLFNDAIETPNSRASLVADIFTDPNYGAVLEVATGYLEQLIVKVPAFNGTTMIAVGPVFSYYEFHTSVNNRMTDEEWRGILRDQSNQASTSSSKGSIFRGFWSSSYMVSTDVTSSIIFYDSNKFEPPSWYLENQNKLFNSYTGDFVPEPITTSQSSNTYSEILSPDEISKTTSSYESKLEGSTSVNTSHPNLSMEFTAFLSIIGLVAILTIRNRIKK